MEKNKLQEYFQKQKQPLPSYTTVRHGGLDHCPQWVTTVTLPDGRKATGDVNVNKTQAEMSAARKALELLSLSSPEDNITMTLKGKIALLVDVENLPKLVDTITKQVPNLDIYVFVGEHHCLCDKQYPPWVTKILSPSTRSDGTDTCMQVYTGMLLAKDKYDTYLIATRDHFGSALVEMIESNNMIWNKRDARLITKITQI